MTESAQVRSFDAADESRELLRGRVDFQMDDGTEIDAATGDVYLVPPGHDSWVVGHERCVALDVVFA